MVKSKSRQNGAKKSRKASQKVEGTSQEDEGCSLPSFERERHQNRDKRSIKPAYVHKMVSYQRTAQLQRSNLMQMQIDALIASARSDVDAVQDLYATLLSEIRQWMSLLTPTEIPSPLGKNSYGYTRAEDSFFSRDANGFTFKQPIDVTVAGVPHLVFKSHVRQPHFDFALEMPIDGIFSSKDFVNYRYLDKRAAWTFTLYGQLRRILDTKMDSGFSFVPEIDFLEGDIRKPYVLLRPGGQQDNMMKKAALGDSVVRLLPAAASETFNTLAMAPSMNCVRWEQVYTACNVKAKEDLPPTPDYNSAVLEDLMMGAWTQQLSSLAADCPGFAGAALLLDCWARNRGFLRSLQKKKIPTPAARIGEASLVMVLAHVCLLRREVAQRATPLQLVKLVFAFFAQTPFHNASAVIGQEPVGDFSDSSPEERGLPGISYPVTLFDCDKRSFNLLWREQAHAAELIAASRAGMSILDEEKTSCFERLFQQEQHLHLRYDLLLTIPLRRETKAKVEAELPSWSGLCASDEEEIYRLSSSAAAGKSREAALSPHQTLEVRVGVMVALVVFRGLGRDRVKSFALRYVTRGDETHVTVGMQMCPADTTTLNRTVDRGPVADHSAAPAVAAFDAFWGSKAELRRFKDGSVHRTVTWAPPANLTNSLIPETRLPVPVPVQIVKSVLRHHLPRLTVVDIVDAPAAGTRREKANAAWEARIVFCPLGSAGAPWSLSPLYPRVVRAVQELTDMLNMLETLPMKVRNIHVTSEVCRYADLPVKNPQNLAPRDILLEIVIDFHDAGGWPRDPPVVSKLKTAFLLAIQKEVQERGVRSFITEDFLDLHMDVTFRLRIYHPSEVTSVFSQVSVPNAPWKHRPTGIFVEKIRTLWWLPRVSAVIHSMALSIPAFAATLRIAKYWGKRQGLVGFEMFIEHLVVAVFEGQDKVSQLAEGAEGEQERLGPVSVFDGSIMTATIGFMRYLHLLATFPLKSKPLFVTMGQETGTNSEETAEMRLQMRQAFERLVVCRPAMWVASPLDPHCILLRVPPSAVLERIVAASKAAFEHLSTPLVLGRVPISMQGLVGNYGLVLNPDLRQFDFIIKLKSLSAILHNATRKKNVQGTNKKRKVLHFFSENECLPPKPTIVAAAKTYIQELQDGPLSSVFDVFVFLGDGEKGTLLQTDVSSILPSIIGLKIREDAPPALRCRTLSKQTFSDVSCAITQSHDNQNKGSSAYVLHNPFLVLTDAVARGKGLIESFEATTEMPGY